MTARDPVAAYEGAIAASLGIAYAVAFGHARTALQALLSAAGLGPGDLVMLSPLTCRVVPLSLMAAGLRPHYADIQPGTLNLDPAAVRARLVPGVKAVLVQRTYGLPHGVEEVVATARAAGLFVVEDCAQCMPTRAGIAPGLLGDAAIFSLGQLKPLPARSGGVAVLRDATLAQRMRAGRDALPQRSPVADAMDGAASVAEPLLLGPRTYWMALDLVRALRGTAARAIEDEIEQDVRRETFRASVPQAERGLRALGGAEALAADRDECCRWYETNLGDHPGVNVVRRPAGAPLYYLPVLSERKQSLLAVARSRRMALIAWPDRTPIFEVDDPSRLRLYGYEGGCAEAERAAQRLVGLPTGPRISPDNRARIASLLRDAA